MFSSTKLENRPHSTLREHNAVLSGYITTLKNKQKPDVSSEGPSSRVSSREQRLFYNRSQISINIQS